MPGVSEMAWRVLNEILPSTGGMIVSLGLPVFFQNGLFNCACVVADGKVLGFVGKRFLAGDGIHYEPRWFKPWPSGVVSEVSLDGRTYTIGDVHFDCGGIKIGFEICEDAWVAKRPGAALALEGVDLILNPSASHFAFGKLEVRKRFVLEGSRAFGVTYVYSNLVGNEAGRAIYDGGALIASGGRMVAEGPRFTFSQQAITPAVIDVDATRVAQARTASFTPDVGHARNDRIVAPFAYPAVLPEAQQISQPAWEAGEFVREEEFARAEALALFDYLRKSRSGGFVVSLSGGADSAAVSCLVGLMVEMAVAELGLSGFLSRLSYLRRVQSGATTPRDLTHALLTCVYQSTRNSGDVTRTAARKVAEAINAAFLEFDVDQLVQEYVAIVSKALGRKLEWETDDVALQNVQARVRAPGVWMLANVNNALLLSTSNRSEAAVGYATMDGDTSGGLSPIAGIDKNFLRQWLRWMETRGPDGLYSIAALSYVNKQAPTAELRPQESHQTDEQDLMPYDLLDAVERAAIRDKKTPVEVFQSMLVLFPRYDAAQLGVWVERFFRLWCRNQWKRERYAPSFHLDDENLDPKTWCRFPILSGGFERELGELRAYVASLDKGKGRP
jgi:NAD+ synthase (glutamine-hydrolysing)